MRPVVTFITIISMITANFTAVRPVAAWFDQIESSTRQMLLISTPADADVFIDGRRVGATPYAGRFTPGTYQVRVAKDRYVAWERRVDLQDDRRFVITLSRVPRQRSRAWLWTLLGIVVAGGAAGGGYYVIKNRVSGTSSGGGSELPGTPPNHP